MCTKETKALVIDQFQRVLMCTKETKALVIDQFQLQEAKNNLKLFRWMLCNGASFAKALISIYRVLGLI